MKQLMFLLLALLLCGCSTQKDTVMPPLNTTPAAVIAHTEPSGSLYIPNSEVEILTDGALKAYQLQTQDATALLPFGEHLLIFSPSALYKFDTGFQRLTAETPSKAPLSPSSPALQASSKGVTCFDAATRTLVFLDTELNAVRSVTLPENIQGEPALSADRKHLYYMTPEELRTIHLDTGLDRLIRQMSYPRQTISGLHRDGDILEFYALEDNGAKTLYYVDTATGELLHTASREVTLHTDQELYFAQVSNGAYQELLVGSDGTDIRMLHTPSLEARPFPLLEQNLILTSTINAEGTVIDCYDLTDGSRPSSLALPGKWTVLDITAGVNKGYFWVLLKDTETGENLLCSWDSACSNPHDDTAYLGIRRTAENPDTYGLQQCAEVAAEISAEYGIEILLWQDALKVPVPDYSLTGEYQVPLLRHELQTLRQTLSAFPEGMLRKAVSGSGDGILRVCLVRSITSGSGTMTDITGIHFLQEETGNHYVFVNVGQELPRAIYHELFHAVESRVYSVCDAYDGWNRLNPPDFTYDFSYNKYLLRSDEALISGETRAFIDYYSMSFPKEDRARIMEYACLPGNKETFSSETMQKKLRMLCEGIRIAYELEDVEEAFLWEQYLREPFFPNT